MEPKLGFGSQFNEDKIIARLLKQIAPKSNVFCDIGARSPTRWSNSYVLSQRGWRVYYYEQTGTAYSNLEGYNMPPRSCYICQSVTPENVNYLVPSDVSILSIDVDGNDYHIWAALGHTPDIVIIESNRKGKMEGHDILPYDPKNSKRRGSGPKALCQLAYAKGYQFHKMTGVNLIFLHQRFGTNN